MRAINWGGHAYWEQSEENPLDSTGNKMHYLMQIGHQGVILSNNVDVNAIDWPTWGRGHIFISKFTGELAYIWSCD